MTTVTSTLSIKSFRKPEDPLFLRALEIYTDCVHHQAKTNIKDIVYWLEHAAAHPKAHLYFCGLFLGVEPIGYVQFAYFGATRLIHVDYLVIAKEHRTRGRYFFFIEQMREFLKKERIDYDLITAEVSLVEDGTGRAEYASKLIKLFRLAGMGELKIDYVQPMLGWGQEDTAIPAKLLIAAPVPTSRLSVSRYLEVVRTIYFDHYRLWYEPLFPDFDTAYSEHVRKLLHDADEKARHLKFIEIDLPDIDIDDGIAAIDGIAKRTLRHFVFQILGSGVAAGLLNWFLTHKALWNTYTSIGAALAFFGMLALLATIKNRGQLEAVKFVVAVCRDLFR